MSKKKKFAKSQNIVSLRALCAKAGISYNKAYASLFTERYNTLVHADKMNLVNTFHDETEEFFSKLGFHIKIHAIKDPTPRQLHP